MSDPSKPAPIELTLQPEMDPIYANLVRISHSPAEIVLDFARVLPGQSGSTPVLSRVLMSPMGAKMLLRALGDNLARYEAAFGEIRIPHDSNLANDLFRGVQPPEPPKES